MNGFTCTDLFRPLSREYSRLESCKIPQIAIASCNLRKTFILSGIATSFYNAPSIDHGECQHSEEAPQNPEFQILPHSIIPFSLDFFLHFFEGKCLFDHIYKAFSKYLQGFFKIFT